MAAAGGQGEVDGVALALAAAILLGVPRVCGVVGVLVDADEEHLGGWLTGGWVDWMSERLLGVGSGFWIGLCVRVCDPIPPSLHPSPATHPQTNTLHTHTHTHIVVLVKGLLRAVPVVHIIVDDGHLRQAQRVLGVQGRQRHVVEEAEAHATVTLGVVPERRMVAVAVA